MKGNLKELGTYLENINKYSLIMFYGPNGYSIEENYKKTFDNLKGKNDEPFEAQELISKNILTETDIFYQQINSMPFGGGNSVLKINLLETESVGCLKDFLKTPIDGVKIIVKAGQLAPRSSLRKNIEKSPIAISIPIYEDSQRDLNLFIKDFFKINNFSISNSGCLKISSLMGNDKNLIKNSLELLLLYSLQQREKDISESVIDLVLRDEKLLQTRDLCNYVGLGNVKKSLQSVYKLRLQGYQPVQFINALSSHFQKIHNVSIKRGSGIPISRAMQELKPPVFFKEKESFGKQVHLWETKKTEKVFSILNNAEKEIKNSVNLGELIINDVVLRISAAAKK